MVDNTNILFGLLILLNVVFFFLGYIISRLSHSQANVQSQPVSFFDKNKSTKENAINKISINETKYITDIKTSDLEKKYDNLGEIKVSNENIESSINKLKNLKR